MNYLYPIALTTHLVGLTIMAGSTIVAYVLARKFWSLYSKEHEKAVSLMESVMKLNILFAVGILLLIASGITMMALTSGAYGEQLWFRIKFGLIIVVIINGVAIGRTQIRKLMRLLKDPTSPADRQNKLSSVKRYVSWFYLSQMTFFFLIYTLSVFKFN